MLTTIIMGIAGSIITEVITWVNSKISGTVLKGDAAVLLAALIAFVAGLINIYLVPTPTFQEFLKNFAVVYASSQGFFLLVIQMFNLDVQSTTPTPSTTSAPVIG